ncbi:MAG TPA: NADH-quinone oxidoreductase subunit A [Proteobacteria bacterium]|nr:NADH-quinone oxidoreductase subunit A [Pseudomonadota bacterium]
MLLDYVPVLLMMMVGLGFGVVAVALSSVLGPKRRSRVKKETYECGMATVGATYVQTPIKYYVVALLFLVFDLECVFLYPWAVHYKKLGLFGFVEMVIFMVVLFVCYIYVWKKGALEWE